jgi:hypothetical protein
MGKAFERSAIAPERRALMEQVNQAGLIGLI